MKRTGFFALILIGTLAQAYTFKVENKPISSREALKEGVSLGLTAPASEVESKRELRTWTDRTVKKEMSTGAPEPLLLEVKHEQKGLDDAKVIARQQIYRAIEKHWDRIKDSSLNETAVDSFAKFSLYLKRDLDKIVYIDSKDPKSYNFSLPWADIHVDKKLKKVSYVIRIGSHLDGNHLEDGAEKIVIPDRSTE